MEGAGSQSPDGYQFFQGPKPGPPAQAAPGLIGLGPRLINAPLRLFHPGPKAVWPVYDASLRHWPVQYALATAEPSSYRTTRTTIRKPRTPSWQAKAPTPAQRREKSPGKGVAAMAGSM